MKSKIFFLALAICLCIVIGCTKKNDRSAATVVRVKGEVTVANRDISGREPVSREMSVPRGSIISTSDSSNALVVFGKNDTIHLDQNTALHLVDSPNSSNSSRGLLAHILFGRVYLSCRLSKALTCSLYTSHARLSVRQARVAVEYYPDHGITIAKVITGEQVRILTDQNSRDIRSCRKVLSRSDGSITRSVSLSDKDIVGLEQWIGTTIIDPLLAGTGCGSSITARVNKPPVFVGVPLSRTVLDRDFSDKLTAVDPENSRVLYRLLEAPKGMSIDSITGALSYRPKKSGTYPIHVRAEDSENNSVDLKYDLTVTGVVTAILQVPEIVSPGDSVHISAYRSLNEEGTRKNLLYRFDTDGDGKWDGPFSAAAYAVKVFENEGSKTLRVEVKSTSGKTDQASRRIRIDAPPRAILTCTPPAAVNGTEFLLDASQSLDSSKEKLKIRWDLNGDKTWDFPENGGYDQTFKLNHTFDTPGIHRVIVEVQNSSGLTDTATYTVSLYDPTRITEIQMPDTVAIQDSFLINCITAADSGIQPIEFAWDTDGDSIYEYSSSKNRLKHVYTQSGIYEIGCRVRDDKGGQAVKKRSIVVLNRMGAPDAGGPYKAFINDTIILRGSGSDPDNKITAYLWDLDNDGKAEHRNTESSELPWVFKTRSTFTIRFGIQTDDSAVVWDDAQVDIQNRPPRAKAGDPIVSRPGRKVTLKGQGYDPDRNIVKYSWDFDTDGKWDFESPQTGTTTHRFDEYSTAVFRVTDSDGAQSYDTTKIVICPDGMKTIEDGAYCVDTYEWPNKKGVLPMRNISWEKARKLCRDAGKRLCTSTEWKHACRGGRNKNSFPYGKHYQPLKCNTLGNKKVDNEAAKSGLFPECNNRYGLWDMSGNVAEWTAEGSGALRNVYGGWWQDDQQRAKCESFIPLESNKDYLYVGFRCCK